MKKIKIIDYMFSHAAYSTDFQNSKYILWDRTSINAEDKVIFYTDYSLDKVRIIDKYQVFYTDFISDKIDIKQVAWLLESPDITSQSYKWIAENYEKFDNVLTHSKELLDRGENFLFSPTGGCWIKPEDQKVYEKNKLISIIASEKRMTTGHKLRHQAISIFKDKIDVFGRNYNLIDYKLDGLKEYAFSLTIENTKKDYYFTEKLIDCFMTGTIPIYWGCPSIGNFFNLDGMIIFDNIDDLSKIFEEISIDKYKKMKAAIQENFEKAKDYLIAEDYIYKNYLEKWISHSE